MDFLTTTGLLSSSEESESIREQTDVCWTNGGVVQAFWDVVHWELEDVFFVFLTSHSSFMYAALHIKILLWHPNLFCTLSFEVIFQMEIFCQFLENKDLL